MEPLGQARCDDADHALVPVLAPEDVAALSPPRLGHGLDDLDRLPQDAVLNRLTVAVELLESVRVPPGLVRVLGEHELEGEVGPAQPAGGVDARGEPEAHRAGVDGCRIDTRGAHERLEPDAGRRREYPKARRRERTVFVE